MSNENEEKSYYEMSFYLDSNCNTEFSELNEVTLRSKKIGNFAKRLKLIRNFKRKIFNITIFKFDNGVCNTLIYSSKIKEIEDWFKGMGIKQ